MTGSVVLNLHCPMCGGDTGIAGNVDWGRDPFTPEGEIPLEEPGYFRAACCFAVLTPQSGGWSVTAAPNSTAVRAQVREALKTSTQSALAKRVGVTQPWLSKFLAGVGGEPRPKTIERLRKALEEEA